MPSYTLRRYENTSRVDQIQILLDSGSVTTLHVDQTYILSATEAGRVAPYLELVPTSGGTTPPSVMAGPKGSALHDGATYPARPSGYVSVEWIGPTDPGGAAMNNDTWEQTS